MPAIAVPVLLAFSSHAGIFAPAQDVRDCGEWQTCRALALEAREQGDFERFHDLAWRAVQTRGRRDPELMYLLARAQSLSGRPHDALVMLRRLAELGETFGALTDDDLARARRLPGWPETQALLETVTAAAKPAAPDGDGAAPGAASNDEPAERAAAPVAPGPVASAPAASTPAPALPASRTVARFPLAQADFGGLVYDGVSRRFIVGNVPARKLTVVGEGANRPATYAGAAAALLDVRALRIDRRQGDLWVVSTDCPSGGGCRSALHQLQLISGRVLKVFEPPDETSTLVDVAVAGRHVLVLDSQGPRLLRVEPGGGLKKLIDLPAGEVTGFAAQDDGRGIYVAYRDRLVRVDAQSGAASRVTSGGAEIAGIERLRWHRGGLVAIQRDAADGHASRRVVRIRLARAGARARRVDRLSAAGDDGRVLAMDLAGDQLYYLVAPENAGDEMTVRTIRLP